ncbi:hypothetical protein BGZ99_010142 [Dissophora globulifera]|uniref:DUF1748-domain-containing protein n=1 Tax=Dissophora globulifera TaxID=979702 RepID=A0A9P6RQA0_9FUNG|nr:hypothetical protein BGZ99_010142 [Dissophora globulifera]
MISKIVHYAADAVLVSAVLAGIKRSSGLGVATEKIESGEVRTYVDKYLTIGEWVLDQGSAFLSSSEYFERKR